MTSEMLPCPFCGGKAALSGGTDKTVECLTCSATHWQTFTDEADAIAAWNTRPAPAGMAEIVAAAKAWVEAERTIFHAGSERQANEAAHGITAARARFLSLVAALHEKMEG